jgi:hypothetical protein
MENNTRNPAPSMALFYQFSLPRSESAPVPQWTGDGMPPAEWFYWSGECAGVLKDYYHAAGWTVLWIEPGTKAHKERGWTSHKPFTIPDNWTGGLGIAHQYSWTMALDLDDLLKATIWGLFYGVDVTALLNAPDALRIESGRGGHGKLLYRVPELLPSHKVYMDGKNIVDFRCIGNQDVLPGSQHPSGTLYQWAGGGAATWWDPPMIPDGLLKVWRELLAAGGSASAGLGAGGEGDVVEALAPEIARSEGVQGYLKNALTALDPDMGRDVWVQVGMVLKGCGLDLDVFDEWSSRGGKYRGIGDVEGRWTSFSDVCGAGVGPEWLFKLANEWYGWPDEQRAGANALIRQLGAQTKFIAQVFPMPEEGPAIEPAASRGPTGADVPDPEPPRPLTPGELTALVERTTSETLRATLTQVAYAVAVGCLLRSDVGLLLDRLAEVTHRKKSDLQKDVTDFSKEGRQMMRDWDEWDKRQRTKGVAPVAPAVIPDDAKLAATRARFERRLWGKPRTLDDLLDTYILDATTNEFVNVRKIERLGVGGFNNTYRSLGLGSGGKDGESLSAGPEPHIVVTSDPSFIAVSDFEYRPGRDKLTMEDGHFVYNNWQDDGVSPTSGDVTLWLEHLRWMMPDEFERNHLLDLMAWQIQNPADKPGYALVLGGRPRTGKEAIIDPLRAAFGPRNVTEEAGTKLLEVHKDAFFESKLVIFNEVKIPEDDQERVENDLKQFASRLPERITLRRFGRAPVTIANVAMMVLTTNARRPLTFYDSPERYFCVQTDPKKPREASYYTKLYDWMTLEGGVGHVVGWLSARDVSHFNPCANAPETAWRRVLTAEFAAPDPLLEILRDLVSYETGAFASDVVSGQQVVSHIQTILNAAGDTHTKLTVNTVSKLMERFGAVSSPPQVTQWVPVTDAKGNKIEKRTQVKAYAIRNQEKWAGQNDKNIWSKALAKYGSEKNIYIEMRSVTEPEKIIHTKEPVLDQEKISWLENLPESVSD